MKAVTVMAVLLFTALLTINHHLPRAEGAITCGRVMQIAVPCLGYLRNGGNLSPVCCNAARGLYQSTKGQPGDRRTACACLKAAVPGLGLKFQFADQIASKCGVNLGFRINPSIDCSKVH